MAQRQSKAVTMIILVLSCTQMAVRVKATVLGASDGIPLNGTTATTAGITAFTAGIAASQSAAETVPQTKPEAAQKTLNSTDVVVLKLLRTLTDSLTNNGTTPVGNVTFVAMPPEVNPVDTPNLFAMLNGTDANAMDLRGAVINAIAQQQAAPSQGSAGKDVATFRATFNLEKTARTVQAFVNLPVTAGTGVNVKLLVTRIKELQALYQRLRSFIPQDQERAIEALITGAIQLYTAFITTFPAAYITLQSRLALVARDSMRVARDISSLVSTIINSAIVFRTTPPPNPCPANASDYIPGRFPGSVTVSSQIIANSLVNCTGVSTRDSAFRQSVSNLMSDTFGYNQIYSQSLSLENLATTMVDTLGNFAEMMGHTRSNHLPDPTTVPGGAEAWSAVSSAALNDTNSRKLLQLQQILSGLKNDTVDLESSDEASTEAGEEVTDTLLSFPNLDTFTFNVSNNSTDSLKNSATDANLLSTSMRSLMSTLNLDQLKVSDLASGGSLGSTPFPTWIDYFPMDPCMPCQPYPRPNPAITNALRVLVAAITIVTAIFSLLDRIFELISDALAVIPAALVLYTGSINYALSVRAYEQLLQDTLTGLSKAAVTRWTDALSSLADNLATSSYARLRQSLTDARLQLIEALPLLSAARAYLPVLPVTITVQPQPLFTPVQAG